MRTRRDTRSNRAGYIWRYGITPTKGTLPKAFSKDKTTLECNVTISNLQSGKIYGFAVAGVLTEKNPSISDGEEPNNFGDFIYFQIL